MNEGESLEVLLERIVDACTEFNDEVFYHQRHVEAADQRLAQLYCERVGLGGLEEIKKVLAEIAPPIEEADRERLAQSPIKSREAGDVITEDAVYWVLSSAVGLFNLIQLGKPEGNSLLGREAIRMHFNEILRLPVMPKGDPTAWGRVITEVIWHRRAEEILRVKKEDLEPEGKIYVLIAADAEAACQTRKRKRNATFQRQCGMDPIAFISCDDTARLKALETRSKTPEERDKAAARAARLLADAREIEAMRVTDGDLKEALRDRLVERLERMFR